MAWKEARNLTQKVRLICKRNDVRRDFAFVDQITRSVRSIGANIAEGNDAMSASQFIEFLGYAKRSAAEVRAHLYDAIDEHYISQEEFDALAKQTIKIGSMIAKLIHHLQSLPYQFKRTFTQQSPKNQITKQPNNQ